MEAIPPLIDQLRRIAKTGALPLTEPKWLDDYGPPHRVTDRTNIISSTDAYRLHPHRTFGQANTTKLTRATHTIQQLTPDHVVPSTWGTLEDWATIGKHVRTNAINDGITLSEDPYNHEGCVVYHATHTEGYTKAQQTPPQGSSPATRSAIATLRSINITTKASFHNTYSPLLDSITLMPEHCFTHAVNHVKAFAHELAHATGHPTRLNRPTLTTKAQTGDPLYNQEEVVAELAAALITVELLQDELPPIVLHRSAEYIWRHLPPPRHDLGGLDDATREATRAAEWVLSHTNQKQPPDEGR